MIDPNPSEFDRRDVLPTVGALVAVATDWQSFSVGLLFVMGVRALLWVMVDKYRTVPGPRGMSPDRRT